MYCIYLMYDTGKVANDHMEYCILYEVCGMNNMLYNHVTKIRIVVSHFMNPITILPFIRYKPDLYQISYIVLYQLLCKPLSIPFMYMM